MAAGGTILTPLFLCHVKNGNVLPNATSVAETNDAYSQRAARYFANYCNVEMASSIATHTLFSEHFRALHTKLD